MAQYEGWKNRQTWNVSLLLNNTYDLYIAAVKYMEKRPSKNDPYLDFIRSQYLHKERTSDNIAWAGSRLDYKALNEMMRELVA